MSVYPAALRRDAEARCLTIEWSDGSVQHISWRTLRDSCPCASCRNTEKPGDRQRAGLNVLSPAETRPLEIVRMTPVGNYAYHIEFSDDHSTGIYTFDLLRSLGSSAKST